MSRAFDPTLISILKAEDPVPIYQDISQLLANTPHGQLWEIEILGKHIPLDSGTNYLRDGTAIALSKVRLLQAFFVARGIIHKHLHAEARDLTDDILQASAVVLLMDAEHLTACNIRKRWVTAQLSRADDDNNTVVALNQEKQFLDSLLTARLHRHTKSPTLWNHRRWLLQQFLEHRQPIDVEHELKHVVLVSAERHPRNYYAWDHARWLLRHRIDLDHPRLELVIDQVKSWCLAHHDDISGWTFLDFAVGAMRDPSERSLKRDEVLDEVTRMIESFRWMNESVWVFLRTMATKETIHNLSRERLELTLSRLVLTLDKEQQPRARRVLDQAQKWLETDRETQ
jgi:protein prenyltransferase alpha subunit repeat containing protein 1